MKRGKDDEKIMGPMFPRLHVNDTEKGGPRAPPRNKMALYEQLSIPSQRSTPGRLPLNSNNASNLVPPASSSQGNGQGSVFFPVHLPHSIPTQAEKVHTPQSDRINSNSPLGQLERRKKVGDEDDFMVPIFVHSEMGQSQSKIQNSVDEGKLTPFSPTYSGRSIRIQNSSDKDLEKTSSTGPVLRQEIRSQNDISPAEYISSGHLSVKSPANLSRGDKMDKSVKQANVPTSQENEGHPASRHDRLHDTDAHSREQYGAQSQMEDTECDADVVDNHPGDMEKGHASRQRSISCLGEAGICDKSDDASETSMVDSVSGLDISPDDVVGIIGRKHFWKARRAIVNQQRVFAVQVFELHRLIKVQRSIAGSPHLLVEDSAYLGNPSLKGSPVKKLSAEYVIKSPPHIVKCKDDLEKPDRKMEYSAENAVGKTSVSSVKNGSQPSNYGPYLSNLPPATDTRMSPWGFSQPPGHQWLVPVLSPSEGLIYKPYPGPGFLGTACGGYGPMGPAHLTSNFINPSYGIPGSHHHHQGIGLIPGASPVGHGYFPPYGMPVMNPATISDLAVEQMNQFIGPESQGHSGQLASVNMQQQQSSCNLSSRKNGDISQVAKFPPSKDSELQGSTASCPSGKAQGSAMGHAAKGRDRDALPLFPTTPAIPEGEFQPLDTEQAARVIRVVPHNPSSATESAARIFQSIQEERKQFDSI